MQITETSVSAHGVNGRPRRTDRGSVPSRSGRKGGRFESHDIYKGVYYNALFETCLNLANSSIAVLNIATVDVLGICIYASTLKLLFQP